MSRRLLFCTVLALTIPLAGCTPDPGPQPVPPPEPPPGRSVAGAMRLVAFDSCEQLIADLRKAAKASVGPYGFSGGAAIPEVMAQGGARTMADSAGAAPKAAVPAYSGTNVHEQGADEPDLVKTDGRRIVTVSQGVLRVVDAASRQQTGKLDLGLANMGQLQLLLAGNAALVLAPAGYDRRYIADKSTPIAAGPQALLVDLTAAPKLVSRYRGEGMLVDARMTGSTARVVLRTAPRILFPDPFTADEKKRIVVNREAIDQAPASAWLPGWEVTTGNRTDTGKVDCGRVSRPTDYSGGSLVSVLTFDLTRPELGSGDPVTVVADSDTVYATPDSLYLASDQRWRFDRFPGRAAMPVRQETDLYKFTINGNRPPVYAAAGAVPGFLINQYALSEWDGHLRVATTNRNSDQSAVRVLAEQNGKLVQTGVVDRLGKGERIYSVRFIGARGYVVTFKQTDPLYSLDLSDPAKPAVTGELKITGYSAHLQPVGENRLVGIGQEADGNGRTQGMQVSLFDVSDPRKPRRLAQYHLPGAQSDAEFEPHALLWWPTTNLLVVPVMGWDTTGIQSENGALGLRVTDSVDLIGRVGQPATQGYTAGIQRSLVVGNVLWTLSETGLQASNLSTMDRLSWLPNA